MGAVGGVAAASKHGFDMDAAVTKLLALASAKRAARSSPCGDADPIVATPFRLCSIDDLPEPSPAWHAADKALKGFADELSEIGGLELMVQVYDEAAERHSYHAVAGVSASWDCCHGWSH